MHQTQQGSGISQSTATKSIKDDVKTLRRLTVKASSGDAWDTQRDERRDLQARYGIADTEIDPIILTVRRGCSDEFLENLLLRRQKHLVS